MFQFREGECVALKNDNPTLGLIAGETGKIWALYDSHPPSYEVTFCPQNGSEFDALMSEEELTGLMSDRDKEVLNPAYSFTGAIA